MEKALCFRDIQGIEAKASTQGQKRPLKHSRSNLFGTVRRVWQAALMWLALATPMSALALGTPAGTVVDNAATVDFTMSGSARQMTTNTVTFSVDERIDVVTTLVSSQIPVVANDVNRAILFTITNTGNGTESFALAIDNALAGDDFDPVASVPDIRFDTDGSGDLSPPDQAYVPGVNDPALPADASVDVFIINDIPGTVVDGETGRSQLTATSLTGTGPPGTEFNGQGDGGVDAITGLTGGESAAIGEYLVADTQLSVIKAFSVMDPSGGTTPVPGATITYTITVEVINSGTATQSVLRDPIPTYSTFVPGSILLNGVPITDAIDADAGEYDTSSQPAVVVRLGDLVLADGIQTVVFQVTIDN